MIFSRFAISLVVLVFLVVSVMATLRDQSDPVIGGYDVVAYWNFKTNSSGAIEGEGVFSSVYNNGTFLFASKQNRAKFESDPVKYVPAYGGFCAYAFSQSGKEACVQPRLWYIVHDRLFLMCSEEAGQKWTANITHFIEKGDRAWIQKYGNLTSGPWNDGPFCKINPLPNIPQWQISLVILGIVLVIGVIVFVAIKLRGDPSRSDYEPIH